MIDPFELNFLTVKEASVLLKIHFITMYRLCNKNKIPRIKVGGQWRIPKDVVERLIVKD